MKPFIILILTSLVLLTACQADYRSSEAQFKSLVDQQLTLDKLLVQGQEIAIPADITAHITFDKNMKISGSGGCNRYFGGYELPAAGQVGFSQVGSTKMYCQGKMTVEDGLFQVFDKVSRYKFEGAHLLLVSDDGKYQARFVIPAK